jgi:hypothetical protein
VSPRARGSIWLTITPAVSNAPAVQIAVADASLLVEELDPEEDEPDEDEPDEEEPDDCNQVCMAD